MPVQQLAPPTVSEIERDIAAFETQYQVSTRAFVEADGRVSEIDEDDAVDWFYLVEQLKFLRRGEVISSYSRAANSSSLKNCVDVMDRLAA